MAERDAERDGDAPTPRGPVGRVRSTLERPWVTFLLAALLVVACAVVIVWFVSFSGLTAPAGFVYSQF